MSDHKYKNQSVSPFTQRLRDVFADKGLNPNSASKAMGFEKSQKTYKILEGDGLPSHPWMDAFFRSFPDVSAEYIWRGEGPMYVQSKVQDNDDPRLTGPRLQRVREAVTLLYELTKG